MEADRKFEKFAYIDAREIYLDVARNGYKSADLLMKLGDSYYFNGDLENAMEWYAELISKFSDFDVEYLFRYSQCLRSFKLYDKADTTLKAYYDQKGMEYSSLFPEDTEEALAKLKNKNQLYKIKPVDFNSPQSDFAPQFGPDASVLFSSSRDTSSTKRHKWNNMPYLDIYTASAGQVKKLNGINTPYHESTAILNATKDTLYFTRNNYHNRHRKKDPEGTMRLKLYRAVRKGLEWKNIVELPFNSDDYSVAHPALSPDGKTLYFSSDMPSTKGKSDLYKVEVLANGKYGEPINLGPTINTIGRETFPFVDAKGNLYFSSDGLQGIGGLDVYCTLNKNNVLGKPYRMPSPINSHFDDFSFIYNQQIGNGYFASNRPGGEGSDDIYKFHYLGKEFIDCAKSLTGVITNETDEFLDQCKVILLDENYTKIDSVYSARDGRYTFDNLLCFETYITRIYKPNYDIKETTVRISNIQKDQVDVTHQLHRGHSLIKSYVRVGDDLNDALQLSDIHFNLNEFELQPEAKVELQKIILAMQKNPKMHLRIRAHTDTRGTEEYNQTLSVQRCKATQKYIVNTGKIASDRIMALGLGESFPLRSCPDGQCTEFDHQQNRRCEFIITQTN